MARLVNAFQSLHDYIYQQLYEEEEEEYEYEQNIIEIPGDPADSWDSTVRLIEDETDDPEDFVIYYHADELEPEVDEDDDDDDDDDDGDDDDLVPDEPVIQLEFRPRTLLNLFFLLSQIFFIYNLTYYTTYYIRHYGSILTPNNLKLFFFNLSYSLNTINQSPPTTRLFINLSLLSAIAIVCYGIFTRLDVIRRNLRNRINRSDVILVAILGYLAILIYYFVNAYLDKVDITKPLLNENDAAKNAEAAINGWLVGTIGVFGVFVLNLMFYVPLLMLTSFIVVHLICQIITGEFGLIGE